MVEAPGAADGALAEKRLLPDFKQTDAECETRVVANQVGVSIEGKLSIADLPTLRELVEVHRHKIDTIDGNWKSSNAR